MEDEGLVIVFFLQLSIDKDKRKKHNPKNALNIDVEFILI